MPQVRVPTRRTGYTYVSRSGQRSYPTYRTPIGYAPPAPVAPAKAGGSGGLGVLGGLGGVFVCMFCLATLGLLGLFAAFVALTVFLDRVADALDDVNGGGSAVYVNTALLLAVLCLAGFRKLQRSL